MQSRQRLRNGIRRTPAASVIESDVESSALFVGIICRHHRTEADIVSELMPYETVTKRYLTLRESTWYLPRLQVLKRVGAEQAW